MKSAADVKRIIDQVKQDMVNDRITASAGAWKVALACVGWAYVFGAYGEYCDPSNRRKRYRDDHPTIKTKCKNFNGRDEVPAGCVGCKWFLGTAESDEKKHEGRTRFFDCRGFVYWVLHNLLGMWKSCPAGCTTMWNTESNWVQKGKVAEGVPRDVLVCLFYPDKKNPKKMAHIGFGYNGQTVECSAGVEHHTAYNSKWTDWAIPVCVAADPQPEPGPEPEPTPTPVVRKTLRLGDKGPEVRLMQQDLMKAGETLPRYGADGDFGNETLGALRSFQRKKGLTVDGICGPKTWAELEKYE